MNGMSPPSTEPAQGRIARLRKDAHEPGWRGWIPGIEMLRRYEWTWLRHDVIAGLVLTTMLVPVGVAYAVGVGRAWHLWAVRDNLPAAGLRPVRTQPHSGAGAGFLARRRHPRRDPAAFGWRSERAVALASMMAIVSGVVCILAGVVRLGFVTELLSKPIRYGYMNGIALTVLISQLPKLFGFSIDAEGPLRSLWAIGEAVLDGKANWTTFWSVWPRLAVILLLKGSKRLPGS